MKIRRGFVSNSSSSSFLIAVPKGLDKNQIEELLKTKIGDSFISSIGNDIVRCIVKEMKKSSIKNLSSQIDEEDDYYDKMVKKLEKMNVDIYEGSFGNDAGSSTEEFLCDIDLNYEDKDIFFQHEGGY